ncbi:MAG: DUF4386 domain-containing protein [Acidobacteria bacterium]|nr:DUF4386 domain-containing protein [Acidobacteriota bacterium]
MPSQQSTSRLMGAMLLLHLTAGLILPFVLLRPLVSAQNFLLEGATISGQVTTAVLMLFVGSALPTAISCIALRPFRVYNSAAAYWLLALAVASFVLQAADNAHLLSMVTLSKAYAGAGAANTQAFQAAGVAVGALRKWSHYSFLLAVGCWILLFYGFLYRFRLVPRWLAAFGLVGAAGQIAGVTLRGFLGYPPESRLAMPLAPAYVALALWLIAKGLDLRHHATDLQPSPDATALGASSDRPL